MHFTPSELWEMKKPATATAPAEGASDRSWDGWVAEGRM